MYRKLFIQTSQLLVVLSLFSFISTASAIQSSSVESEVVLYAKKIENRKQYICCRLVDGETYITSADVTVCIFGSSDEPSSADMADKYSECLAAQ